eukprot:738982-Amphidinium_carterae.1
MSEGILRTVALARTKKIQKGKLVHCKPPPPGTEGTNISLLEFVPGIICAVQTDISRNGRK